MFFIFAMCLFSTCFISRVHVSRESEAMMMSCWSWGLGSKRLEMGSCELLERLEKHIVNIPWNYPPPRIPVTNEDLQARDSLQTME